MKEEKKNMLIGCSFLLAIAGMIVLAGYGAITLVKELIALL